MGFTEELAEATSKAVYIQSLNVIDISFSSGHSLEVFVASTPDQKRKGLSNLETIPVHGMLFPYQDSTYRPFTMVDMAFDLDFGWYDSSGKLLDIQQHKAGSTKPVVASKKYNYVLEIASGMLPLADLDISG